MLGVTALALAGLARLDFDDVPRGIFASEDAEYRRLQSTYDDFGSGQARLFELAEAPPHYLKFDRRFLTAVGGDPPVSVGRPIRALPSGVSACWSLDLVQVAVSTPWSRKLMNLSD